MELAIIANPRAGKSRPLPRAEEYQQALRPLGVDVSFHITKGPGDAERLAARLSSRVDVLGIMGGDGTIHEVVNGMMPNPLPIVVIPFGAGNDFSNLIACPRIPSELATVIEKGLGASIDLIDFGGRYCVNSAGLGFEGLVNRYSHRIRRVRGHLRYLIALFKALGSYSCPHFAIVTSRGDEIAGEKLLVSVGNGHRTGGAFYLTPDAHPDDGLIDICIVNPMGRLKMIRLLPKSFNGTHRDSPDVQMLRAESLSIESKEPYPMHIDGEYFDAGPGQCEITIRQGVLPVICNEHTGNKLTSRLNRVL